jgi:hypothetical protein
MKSPAHSFLDLAAPPVAIVLLGANVMLPPFGSAQRQHARRHVASAISWRCFPVVRRKLQHTQPAADPSVPSSPGNISHVHGPTPSNGTVYEE